MRILYKLLIAFLFVSILAAIAGSFGINAALSISAKYDEVGEETLPVMRTLEEMRFSGLRIVTSTHEYYSLLSANETNQLEEVERAHIMEGMEDFDILFDKYQILVNKFFPGENGTVEKIRTSSEKLKRTSFELVDLRKKGVPRDEVVEKFEEFEDVEQDFLNDIDEAIENEEEEFNERSEELLSMITYSIKMISITSLLSFFLALFIGVIIAGSISSPLNKLKNAAEEIKIGKLDSRVDIISNDEMGILADAFNTMVDKLSHEISEHKNSEDKLKKKTDFVTNILESLSHPFYVVNTSDYSIALANSAACKEGDAERSTCYALMHKQDKPCWTKGEICPIEEVKKTKKSAVAEHVHYDKDGNARIVEIHCYPIFNSNGEVVQVIEYSLDITERKRSQEKLAESEQSFRTLFDNATDGIMLADVETKKEYKSNKAMCKMLGYSPEEISNISVMDLHPEKDMPWIMEMFEKQARGEISLVENIPVKRKDGTIFYADINTSSMNIAGRLYNIGIFRDITERRRNEEMRRENERLHIANRTKSDFLTVMSHELRTPLNAIIGFSELLSKADEKELNEKHRRFAKNIYTSGHHLLKIINDVLDLSKAESGKIEIIIEKTSIQNVLSESVELIKENAAKRNIKINKKTASDVEYIETDENRLKQVLNNLLDNAVKFSKPEGGTITITAEKEKDMARFSVLDTGIGIKKEDMGRLFQSFEQMESGIARKYEGTGLGLAVSKKIVELLGGKMSVESKYGEGSTFTFTLPIEVKKEGEAK